MSGIHDSSGFALHPSSPPVPPKLFTSFLSLSLYLFQRYLSRLFQMNTPGSPSHPSPRSFYHTVWERSPFHISFSRTFPSRHRLSSEFTFHPRRVPSHIPINLCLPSKPVPDHYSPFQTGDLEHHHSAHRCTSLSYLGPTKPYLSFLFRSHSWELSILPGLENFFFRGLELGNYMETNYCKAEALGKMFTKGLSVISSRL